MDESDSEKLSKYFKISLKRLFTELNSNLNTLHSTDVKNCFFNCLVNFVELYHFFKYKQNQLRLVKFSYYSEYFWKEIKNIHEYTKKLILSASENLVKANVSKKQNKKN